MTIPTEIADIPWVLWIVAAVFVLRFISDAFPKILGPVSQAIHDTVAKRRAAADVKENAAMENMREQLKNLQETVDEMREFQQRHEEALTVHAQWDWAVKSNPDHAMKYPSPPLYPLPGRVVNDR